MKKLLLLLVCLISPAIAQTIPEGIGQGYDGELKHVTSQLLARRGTLLSLITFPRQ